MTALGVIARPGQKPAVPPPPPNLLADYARGRTMAAFATTAALLARDRVGRGQFIDFWQCCGRWPFSADQIANWRAEGVVGERVPFR